MTQLVSQGGFQMLRREGVERPSRHCDGVTGGGVALTSSDSWIQSENRPAGTPARRRSCCHDGPNRCCSTSVGLRNRKRYRQQFLGRGQEDQSSGQDPEHDDDPSPGEPDGAGDPDDQNEAPEEPRHGRQQCCPRRRPRAERGRGLLARAADRLGLGVGPNWGWWCGMAPWGPGKGGCIGPPVQAPGTRSGRWGRRGRSLGVLLVGGRAVGSLSVQGDVDVVEVAAGGVGGVVDAAAVVGDPGAAAGGPDLAVPDHVVHACLGGGLDGPVGDLVAACPAGADFRESVPTMTSHALPRGWSLVGFQTCASQQLMLRVPRFLRASATQAAVRGVTMPPVPLGSVTVACCVGPDSVDGLAVRQTAAVSAVVVLLKSLRWPNQAEALPRDRRTDCRPGRGRYRPPTRSVAPPVHASHSDQGMQTPVRPGPRHREPSTATH